MMSVKVNSTSDVFGATLTRGKFVKGSGALVVALSLPAVSAGTAAAATNELDPTQLASWLTINPDNTVTMRTGKYEFGQGTASAAYAQIVAEELNIPFSAITKIIMGDTDRTPDGGIGAGLLGGGATNLRKVAAYTYQALLGMASTQLGVPVGSLSVTNGVVSGGGKTVTYGDLVKNQVLKLTIPVTGTPLDGISVQGTPPTKPTSQYTVIGTSQPMASIPPIVTGTATYVANVRIPGMLHARMVRPKTYGSTLVSVGKLDKKAWPTAQVFVKGNLVAVLSPKEWEAVGAAGSVAAKTKWSDWAGLPGSGNLYKTLRERDYSTTAKSTQNKGNAGAALATAAKKMSATYMKPYIKHGPIGPSVAVAAPQSDGTMVVWAHTQYPQHLRKMLASVLQTSHEKVVVRVLDGSGHYGRSNPGPDGAEADAAILAQALRRPIKVQWTREEDMAWSVSGFPQLADIQLGLDSNGNMVAYQGDYHQTGRYDGRGLGALLAGLPPGALEDGNPQIPQSRGHFSWVAAVSAVWPYEKVPHVLQTAHNSAPLGQVESPYKVGIRIHSFRTPVMREQAFALEGMVNEAAAAVGADPIEYRLRHTDDPRLVNVLNTLKSAHRWETRPSPASQATATGSKPVKGRGMGVMLRSNGRWAAAADVTVDPRTGKVTIDRYTVVVDPGIVINPLQLRRITEGGTVQGISEVMKEGITYDKGMITSRDWVQYPIMRFADVPEINVVLVNNPSVGAYNGAGEGSNGLPYVSIPAAVFDATGKFPRSLPLRPANMRALLKS